MKGTKIMKKLGFTLAEVLITLVIIGVIAAMTVPTLMNNTNSQEFRSAFKKAISATNQALTLHYALEGLSAQDCANASALVNDIFKKRMSVINSDTTFTNGCSGGTVFVTADGLMYCVASTFNNTTGCDSYNEQPCGSTSPIASLWIDVNGSKKPNQHTTTATRPRDIYQATIYAQKVVPFGAPSQQVMYDKGVSGANN